MSYGDTAKLDVLAVGEPTMSRSLVVSATVGTGAGIIRPTFFTAQKSETITQVRSITGNTAAVGATLCRTGIYEVDNTSGTLTLVASTANDTALWIATATTYTKSLSASFAKKRGTRYAVAHLVVGASTAPTLIGNNALTAAEVVIAPRICGILTALSDLPSTILDASMGGTAHLAYTVLLP